MSVKDRLAHAREPAVLGCCFVSYGCGVVAEWCGPPLERLARAVGRLAYCALSLAIAGLAWFAAIVLVLLLMGDVEIAQAATSKISRNVGAELKAWATVLLFSVAALVGIPVLARREFSGGLVLFCLVLVVGSFVFAQPALKTIINGLARSFSA